jgi:hypothetical protein
MCPNRVRAEVPNAREGTLGAFYSHWIVSNCFLETKVKSRLILAQDRTHKPRRKKADKAVNHIPDATTAQATRNFESHTEKRLAGQGVSSLRVDCGRDGWSFVFKVYIRFKVPKLACFGGWGSLAGRHAGAKRAPRAAYISLRAQKQAMHRSGKVRVRRL